ncbi:MAG: LysR family transcriptional regulator, partial [Butyrivibrio sp.]|nr:LysR family transcriptional regulator [Butyrivibrio sp.]
MNLQQLYYFRTLADVKHFTKASMQLNVAQSSLSHSINDLESELGIELFQRDNRQVTLTKYGALFLDYVKESLNTLDAGRIKLEDYISPDHGTVSLQYVSSINPFITYLMSRYYEDSGIHTIFQLHQESNRIIQQNVLSGTADLGIGALFEDVPDMESHPIGKHEMVLLVSDEHPFAGRESIDLKEIKDSNFIAYKRPDCTI